MNFRTGELGARPVLAPAMVHDRRWDRYGRFDQQQWTTNIGHRVKVLTLMAVLALAVLNIGDAYTTHLVLQHTPAGAREANPLAGVLISNGSLLYVKMAIVALLGVATVRDRPRLGLLIGMWTATGLYMAAVLSNILLLRMLH